MTFTASSGSDHLHSHTPVVGDKAEIADSLGDMLQRAGYGVTTAESGAVALGLLVEARFDATASDERMPINGATRWRATHDRRPRLARRLLFVIGDTLSQPPRHVLRDSGCASLGKPIAWADPLAAVQPLAERPAMAGSDGLLQASL